MRQIVDDTDDSRRVLIGELAQPSQRNLVHGAGEIFDRRIGTFVNQWNPGLEPDYRQGRFVHKHVVHRCGSFQCHVNDKFLFGFENGGGGGWRARGGAPERGGGPWVCCRVGGGG